MDRNEFFRAIDHGLTTGHIFDNPGGNTSRISKIDDREIHYVRGSSTIRVSLADLYSSYRHFLGQRVTSTDLRKYAPNVFDSSARPAGHSCNCTFFFMLLQEIGLADAIVGEGKRGSPYSVKIQKR